MYAIRSYYEFQAPLTAWDENGMAAHWRNRESGQPFFAVFNYDDTHENKMWPPKSIEQMLERLEMEDENQFAPARAFFESALKEKPLITDPDQVVLPPYLPDTPATRRALARHYDNLADRITSYNVCYTKLLR